MESTSLVGNEGAEDPIQWISGDTMDCWASSRHVL